MPGHSDLPQRSPGRSLPPSLTPDTPSRRLKPLLSSFDEASPEDVSLDTPTDASSPKQHTNTHVYGNRNGNLAESAGSFQPTSRSFWDVVSSPNAQASSPPSSRKRQALDDSPDLDDDIRKKLKFDSPAHDKRYDPSTPARSGRGRMVADPTGDVFGGSLGGVDVGKTPGSNKHHEEDLPEDDREPDDETPAYDRPSTPPLTLCAAMCALPPIAPYKRTPRTPRQIRLTFSLSPERRAPLSSLRLTETYGVPLITITSPSPSPPSPPREDSVASSPTYSPTGDSDAHDPLSDSLLHSPLLEDSHRASSPAERVETAHEQQKLISKPFIRGVTVRSEQAVQKGATVLKVDPLHSVLQTSLLETHCSGCFMTAEHKARETRKTLAYWTRMYRKCSQCKAVVFCSARCYARTAHSHNQECLYLRLEGEIASTQVRLLVRLCVSTAENKGVHFLPDYHLYNLPAQEILGICEIVKQVQQVLSYNHNPNLDFYKLRQKANLVNLTRRARATTFVMHDWKAMPVGLSISPQLAQFNHSCRPTAIIACPFGTAVDQPLRVQAIDPLYAGQELTISYLGAGIPLHKRTRALASYGFSHDCNWCKLEPVDYRWAIHHVGCARGGFVPLAVPDPCGQLRTSQCSGCAKRIWADVDETPYPAMMQALQRSWKAECDGLWNLDDHDPPFELGKIQSKVNEALVTLPHTFYPIPHLFWRMARLLRSLSTASEENLESAIEYLTTAHEAITDWNNNEPRPMTLSLCLDQLSVFVDLIKLIFDKAKAMETSGGKVGPDGKKYREAEYEAKAKQYLERLHKLVSQATEVVGSARDEATGMFGDGCYMLDEVEAYDRKLLQISRKVGL